MLSTNYTSDTLNGKKDTYKIVFDKYFGKLNAIASRYSKSTEQASNMATQAFHSAMHRLSSLSFNNADEEFETLKKEFILHCVNFIKSIGSEYYVASTVHPTAKVNQSNYNLFESNYHIDYNKIPTEVIINALQKIVPSQRLVFNMHVIDGFSLTDVATYLESGEETVKSNLEKARFNFQKNIEKQLKSQLAP